MFTDLKSFYHWQTQQKLVKIWPLKISPQLKRVATLPCAFSLITTLVWECSLFSDTDVLQGSVATRLVRRSGIFNNHVIANFLGNLTMKKFWKSVKVWWSYSHVFGVSLFMRRGVVLQREVQLSRARAHTHTHTHTHTHSWTAPSVRRIASCHRWVRSCV